MECTSPRYVSIPSEVQTCYTLEEKNTFRVAAVKRYMPCSPDDYINFFFIQGQVIYNILMPQASIRASQIVRLEEWNLQWNSERTQLQLTWCCSVWVELLCVSLGLSPHHTSFMCKYSNANTHALYTSMVLLQPLLSRAFVIVVL